MTIQNAPYISLEFVLILNVRNKLRKIAFQSQIKTNSFNFPLERGRFAHVLKLNHSGNISFADTENTIQLLLVYNRVQLISATHSRRIIIHFLPFFLSCDFRWDPYTAIRRVLTLFFFGLWSLFQNSFTYDSFSLKNFLISFGVAFICLNSSLL